MKYVIQWTNRDEEIHTVTFRPANVPDVDFITGPGANPLAAYPSDPPPALLPYDGTNHGNGFLNSGLLDNDSGSPSPPTGPRGRSRSPAST